MRALFLTLLLALAVLGVQTSAHADGFTSKIILKFEVQPTRSLDMLTIAAPLSYSKEYSWTSGAGADQAQQMFTDSRTLTASTSEELDLAGSLTNGFGQTITFTEICAIYIEASSANTNNLLVGGAASNGLVNWVSNVNDEIIVRPGGSILLIARDADGYAVTADTGDLFRIENAAGSTSVTYKIVIVGRGSAS